MKRSIKRIVSLLLALVVVLPIGIAGTFTATAATASPKYTATEGWGANEDGVFEISSPGDLLAFAANASENNYYKNKTIVLTADIDLNPGWDASTKTKPTNVWPKTFYYLKGTLDGQGHTIKGFFVEGSNAAIFSEAASDLLIKDLRIENSYFHATSTGGVGIFRYAKGKATFENVYMDAICVADAGNAAGFVSYYRGDSDSNKPQLVFKNCAFAGSVTGKASAGAFVGTNDKPAETGGGAYSLTMTDCVNYGTITCTDASGLAAGLIGECANTASFTRCYNAGTATTALFNVDLSTYENLDQAPVTITVEDCYYLATASTVATTKSASATATVTLKYDGTTATAAKSATAAELVQKSAFQKTESDLGWALIEDGKTALPTTLACSVLGHTTKWVVDKAATETATGLRHQICTACDEILAIEKIPVTATAPTPTVKDYSEVKTYKITENLDYIKTFGRTFITPQGLGCDHTATGIEFNADVKGKVTISLTMTANQETPNDCYFTLWVDGVRSATRFQAVSGQTTTLELGDFATAGVHNFRFVRQNEAAWANVDLLTVSFAGGFEQKPVDSGLYIEFIGASMNGGYGNLGTTATSNPSYPVNSDGTQAYPYLTAESLFADYSVVSKAGIGVLAGTSLPAYKVMYEAESYFRSATTKYEPTRVPDVVISGLGHNDINKMKGSGTTLPASELANYKVQIKDLVNSIWTLYGKNVPIVWTHGMMATSSENFEIYGNTVKEAFDELGGEAAGLYVVKLTADRSGGGSHPTVAGHQTQSAELVSFLLQKEILLKDEDITVPDTKEHDYDDEGYCSLCGEYRATFAGASLTLEDTIAVKFKVAPEQFQDTEYSDPYVVFAFNGKQFTVTDYTIDSKGWYAFAFRDIAPRMMNDSIVATLYATYEGEQVVCQKRSYSVKEYCYNMLAECNEGGKYANDEKFKTLLVDLLHYGAAAQIYANYKVDTLVTADLTDEQKTWATDAAPSLSTVWNLTYETVANPTVTWKAGGLLLEDAVTMRFKFAADSVEGLTVKFYTQNNPTGWTVNSDAFVKTTDGYYVYFNGLKARQMRETVYVTVYRDDVAISNTVSYSIESYAYAKQNDQNVKLTALLEAMMKYGDSAYRYINR